MTEAAKTTHSVSAAQAAAVAKLEEVESLQTQGLITAAQHQTESQKLLLASVQ